MVEGWNVSQSCRDGWFRVISERIHECGKLMHSVSENCQNIFTRGVKRQFVLCFILYGLVWSTRMVKWETQNQC